jgi:hypothetical protein
VTAFKQRLLSVASALAVVPGSVALGIAAEDALYSSMGSGSAPIGLAFAWATSLAALAAVRRLFSSGSWLPFWVGIPWLLAWTALYAIGTSFAHLGAALG